MNRNDKFNAKHRQDKYIIIGVLASLIVLGGLMMWLSSLSMNPGNIATSTPVSGVTATTSNSVTTPAPAIPDGKITAFAKYLQANGITMYGAVWCTHCQDQKEAFGEAFQYVPYVECPDNVKVCLAKGVTGYPTWMKPDGTKLEGFNDLSALAVWAGFKY